MEQNHSLPSPVVFSELLAQARQGSREGVGVLLESCLVYLLRRAKREVPPNLRAKACSSDLVQETILAAIKRFPQFRGQTIAEFLAWLLKIFKGAVRTFRRAYRDRKKREIGRECSLDGPEGLQAFSLAIGPCPAVELAKKESRDVLDTALIALPENYRRAFLLYHQHGITFRVIGMWLGVSEEAARQLCRRARQRLALHMIQAGIFAG